MQDQKSSGGPGTRSSKSFPLDPAKSESALAGLVPETRSRPGNLDELVSNFLDELDRLSDGQESVRPEAIPNETAADFITHLGSGELVASPVPQDTARDVPLASGTEDKVINPEPRAIEAKTYQPPVFQYMSRPQVKNKWVRPLLWLFTLGMLLIGLITIYSYHFKKWITGKPSGAVMPVPAPSLSAANPSPSVTRPAISAENLPAGGSPAVPAVVILDDSPKPGLTTAQTGDRTQKPPSIRSKPLGSRSQPASVASSSSGAITRSKSSSKSAEINRPDTARVEKPDVSRTSSSQTIPTVSGPPAAHPPLPAAKSASDDTVNTAPTVTQGTPETRAGIQSSGTSPTPPAAAEEKLPANPARATVTDLSTSGEHPVAVYKDPTPAMVVKKVTPSYPAIAKSLGIRKVELDVDVNEKGQVVRAVAVSGPAVLRAPAEEALKKWQFTPATQNGVNLKSTVRVSILFSPN